MPIVLTFLLNAGLNVLLGLAFASLLSPAAFGRFAIASILAIMVGTAWSAWLRAKPKRFGAFPRSSNPIVATTIYQGIALLNRIIVAHKLGFADAGQLALATDVSLGLLLSAGATLDVHLSQRVMRREVDEGRAAAQAQIRQDMITVTAVLALVAVVYIGAMPAFEAMLVPAAYRGAFEPVSLALLPGIVLFCLARFALNPVFRFAGRSGPMTWAAALALAADLLGVLALPPTYGIAGVALVHSASLCLAAAVAAALAFREVECRPAIEDLVWTAVATCAAAFALSPARQMSEPILALAAAAVLGTSAFALAIFLGDVGGARGFVRDSIASRRPQRRSAEIHHLRADHG